MLSDIPKAQHNFGDKTAAAISWTASKDDVVVSKREHRSSKPEVVYHLSPPDSTYTSTPVRPLSRPILQQPVSGGPVIRPSAPVLQFARYYTVTITCWFSCSFSSATISANTSVTASAAVSTVATVGVRRG